MTLEKLIALLEHQDPRARLITLYTIKMVDEVRALDAISARVPLEMDTKVEDVLKKVGRSLNKLKQSGFDTIYALCEHFNVYSDVISHADDAEYQKIHSMVQQTSDKRQDDDFNDVLVNTASVMIASRVMGVGAMLGGISQQPDVSSGVETSQAYLKRQKRRIPPRVPTQANINRWVKLLQAPEEARRQDALVQMHSANNPAALQYMAQAYMTDRSQQVRETAKRLGRLLYWNSIYYRMDQAGEIAQIMQDFADSLGVTLPDDHTGRVQPQVNQSISDILSSASETRKKRGLKH